MHTMVEAVVVADGRHAVAAEWSRSTTFFPQAVEVRGHVVQACAPILRRVRLRRHFKYNHKPNPIIEGMLKGMGDEFEATIVILNF